MSYKLFLICELYFTKPQNTYMYIYVYIYTQMCIHIHRDIHYIYSYTCAQAHVCGHKTIVTQLGLSCLISRCGPISRQGVHPGADGVTQASGPLSPPWPLLKERLDLPCYLGLLSEPELKSFFWFLSRKKKISFLVPDGLIKRHLY